MPHSTQSVASPRPLGRPVPPPQTSPRTPPPPGDLDGPHTCSSCLMDPPHSLLVLLLRGGPSTCRSSSPMDPSTNCSWSDGTQHMFFLEQRAVVHRSVEQTRTACGGPVKQGGVCCVHRAGRTAGGGSVDTKNNMCPLGKKNSVWWVRACPMGGQQSCSSCPMGPPHAALLPIPRVRWTPARAVLLAWWTASSSPTTHAVARWTPTLAVPLSR